MWENTETSLWMVATSIEEATTSSVLNAKTTLQNRNILLILYFHDVASNFVVVVVILIF